MSSKMNDVKTIAIKKASKSICRYNIVAMGFNKKDEMIIRKTNLPRYPWIRGGIHAEMRCLKESPPSLKYLIIARVNKKGEFLPIDPCSMCLKKANELGVKIYTISKSTNCKN